MLSQRLEIELSEDNPALAANLQSFEHEVKDSLGLHNSVLSVKSYLFSQGYLFSKARLELSDSIYLLTVESGSRLFKREMQLILPPNFALPRITELKQSTTQLDSAGFRKTLTQYLHFLEENGYPFAQLKLDSYTIQRDTLHAAIRIYPGPLITIDSVVIKGFDRFSPNVLKYELQYKKGMLYRESYLRELPQLATQVEYLNMSRPPAIAFTKSKTILYLYMEEVKSNQIDGVLGLNTDENGKVKLNGDFQLRLLHVLKKGEEIKVRWRRPDASVQSLNFDVEIPYLFRTPFWVEGNLAIFRQDSSFVNTSAQGLLKYLLESGSFLSGGISYKSSNVLIKTSSQLESFTSFNTTDYKIGLELHKTNRIIVPTRGFMLEAYGISGKRKSENHTQAQYGWEISAAQYIPIFKRHILKIGLNSEARFGGQLFTNELYRIGGLKTLRGFNEQSIYASSYGIGTLEYRYMIGDYDYLTLFSDVAYVENNSTNFTSTLFTGLGAGINFQTRGGIFSLFFALGKDDQNPFDFRTSKIHFGYVNRF